MTYEEISEFLGVSVAAIKNRLYRARRRLKEEEPMVKEALDNFQITPNLTENIMQEISRLKPITPSGSKPARAVDNRCFDVSRRLFNVRC